MTGKTKSLASNEEWKAWGMSEPRLAHLRMPTDFGAGTQAAWSHESLPPAGAVSTLI